MYNGCKLCVRVESSLRILLGTVEDSVVCETQPRGSARKEKASGLSVVVVSGYIFEEMCLLVHPSLRKGKKITQNGGNVEEGKKVVVVGCNFLSTSFASSSNVALNLADRVVHHRRIC